MAADPPKKPTSIILTGGGDEFELQKEIGKGAIWKVYRARRKRDAQMVAVKEATIKQCRSEWLIFDELSKMDTKSYAVGLNHVVKLWSTFEKSPIRYLVTELCSTELVQFLNDLPGQRLPVDQLKIAARHLSNGYAILYEKGIVHKNLSSKNILVQLTKTRVVLKISGFNCAEMKRVADDDAFRTIVGRPTYMAPEIRKVFMAGGRQAVYDAKSDLWSIGLLVYECANGTAKAVALSHSYVEAFSAGKYRPKIDWIDKMVPEMVKTLVDQLLRIPSYDRLTPENFFFHVCIRSVIDNACIMIDPKIVARLPYDLSALNPPVAPGPAPGPGAGPGPAGPAQPHCIPSSSAPLRSKAIRVRNYEYVDDQGGLLGQGSFGKVWRAKRLSDQSDVALKRVYKDDVDMAEIETMKVVAHPNLLKLLDWFDEYPYMYMVTELCTQDLEHFLRTHYGTPTDRRGKFKHESEVRVLARHLSSAYMAMKNAQILHRDIKPSNVLVGIHSKKATFKLADFGCSKKLNNVNYAQTVLGTPVYMAPELGACLYLKIENAHYDHRADIWSMGLILFKSMAGQLPFDEHLLKRLFYDAGTGRTTSTYAWRFKGEAERRGLSESLRDLLWKALYPDYIRRMTANEFYQHEFHAGLPSTCTLDL